jgi:hypothetical protein
MLKWLGIKRTPSGRYEVHLYYGIYVVPSLWGAFKLRFNTEGWL